MALYDDHEGHARGFGRYLDDAMRDRPHTAAEADRERAQRGRDTVADHDNEDAADGREHRPPPRTGGNRVSRDGKGFGRYLAD
ncbi:hypothetical protein [Gordonia sp. HS-NH1]|uniref:hypothetical protein n=1 Tax=Gordonia sp. HS-NH1 TaxID=1435068 RepID=UPI0006E1E481|nr:hypothetical protein [Gordonia sp. HS-NH1]